MIQLQGDQRKDVQEFLVDKDGLSLDAKTIKVCCRLCRLCLALGRAPLLQHSLLTYVLTGPRLLDDFLTAIPCLPFGSPFERAE